MDQEAVRTTEQEQQQASIELQPKLVERFQLWLQAHLREVIGAAVVLLLAIGGVLYWNILQKQRAETAATLLARVVTYYDNGDYERALYGDTAKTIRDEPVRGLVEIVQEYGSTEAGRVAAFYAGSAYLLQGEIAKARPYFERAATAKAPLVLVGAYAGLAACTEEEGKLAEAAQLYERAATIGAPLGIAERYRFFAAYCYERAGNTQKAVQLYRQLLQENEFSDFAGEAKAGLARLGTAVE